MFEYTAETLPSPPRFDLIFFAAGRDAMDAQDMRLAWMLTAIASLTATGFLMMYKSMWGRREWTIPRAPGAEGDIEI